MPPVNVQADASQVDALLRDLRQRADDPTPAFAAVGRTLVNFIRLCFSASRSPYGATWLPIKFRAPRTTSRNGRTRFTAAGKSQAAANALAAIGKASAGKPLMDTRALSRSFTFSADTGGVDIGTMMKQARLQHFGGRIVPRNARALAIPGPNGEVFMRRSVTIPARPFMPINPAGQVVLPPAWAKAVERSVAEYFGIGATA